VRQLAAIAGLIFTLGCPQPLKTECGAAGQTCCASGDRCESGLECTSDNLCRACGAEGQGCCGGTSCNADLICDGQAICRACGGAGQGCCAGSTCAFGLECFSDNVCRACGNEGQDCCGGTHCATGLECAADKRCHPCGSDGEICCANDRCGAGNECRGDGLCHRCGAEGEECCSGNGCATSLRCDMSVCVMPCGEGCAPGSKTCNSNGGVDLCTYTSPPCTEWSVVLERCPEEQVCREGACVPRCPDACVLGSNLCTSEGLKICVLDEATQCPAYKLAPDSPDNPSCMTGACDGSICWESPLPQGTSINAITGWDWDQLYLLDKLGNIIKRSGETWTYDWRAGQGGNKVLAVANCHSPGTARAVGTNGLSLRRTSVDWRPEDIGNSTVTLRAVGCASVDYALAVGDGGKVFARDESDTWRALPSPTTENLLAADLFGAGSEGWAVGNRGTIVHCDRLDEPEHTTCELEGIGLTQSDLYAVWVNRMGAPGSFLGAGEVIAVGAGGVVLNRVPGGGWMRVAQGLSTKTLRAVYGLPEGDVYVAGDGGAFLYRIGTVWATESFTTTILTGAYASDQSHLFVVGEHGEIWFNDARGGEGPPPQVHWRQFGGRVPTREMLNAVEGTGAQNVYAVGTAGTILHKSGDAWRQEARGLVSNDLHAIAIVSAEEVYAVGDGGVILARRDGTWRREGAGVTSNPLYGAFSDGKTVFAVGPGGTWLEKPVGASGTMWHLVQQPVPDAYFMDISGNASEVWAVGGFCTAVKKKADGTFSTEIVPGCNGDDFSAVWVGPDGEIFLGTTFSGELFHRLQGTWQAEYLGTMEMINGLAVRGGDAWALCGAGELYHRVAGQWRQEAAMMTTYSLSDAYASPEGHVFIVGVNGLIWHRR
jgi:photosystem II stability/assembly factor-like uncharacterized protein